MNSGMSRRTQSWRLRNQPRRQNPMPSLVWPSCTPERLVLAGLVAQKILRKEQNVRRPLRKTSHEVRIPFVSEGDVHAHVVAFCHQLSLQVAPHTIQHLEFETARSNPVLPGAGLGCGNHLLVMGRKAVIDR